MIIWLPIMHALTPDQNLNLQEDMWHYYMTTPFIHRMPLCTDTCITIVTKSMNKFLKHYMLFNTYLH